MWFKAYSIPEVKQVNVNFILFPWGMDDGRLKKNNMFTLNERMLMMTIIVRNLKMVASVKYWTPIILTFL